MSVVVFVVLAAAGWWLLRAAMPRVTPEAPAAQGVGPRVSIIVPARDEAHNLPALLASLRALEPPAHEIIVVDDHSRDATGAIAAAAGARVVTPPPLPEGWRGKCWACQAGAEVATGELLLFTDADTVHGRDSLRRATAALVAARADLVTAVPTHRLVAAWERLQAVFQLLLLVATSGPRHYAIGQYLLFRRATYDALGGHEAVRGAIAEDLALAARLDAAGGKRIVLCAPGLVAVRMYPEGLGAFFRGWTRSFRDGLSAAGTGAFAVTVVVAWLLGAPVALATALAAGDAPMAALAAGSYGLAVVTIARRQRLVGAFTAASALAYPVFVVVFVAVTLVSAAAALLRRPVTWRGRTFKVVR